MPETPLARQTPVLQACDGVTTALDLEAGRAPVEAACAREAASGSPLYYGFSASWAAARMQEVAGLVADGGGLMIIGNIGNIGNPGWQKAAADAELARILEQLSADLAVGVLGIGRERKDRGDGRRGRIQDNRGLAGVMAASPLSDRGPG
jgi:hypothetical protein